MSWEPEPNTFYEPRPAVAPFYIISVGAPFSEYVGQDYDTRAAAEEAARELSEVDNEAYHVVGCVSISGVPQPIPLKASTRALV